jgi:SAM-dependent methyltransferase
MKDARWNDFLFRERDPYAMAKYEILLDWLRDLRGKTVLVVGSGSGEFAALLARAGGDVTAIDIDAPSVELTRQTAEKFGVSIKTEVATIETFSTKDQFDLVAATDVIEHIENDRSAVAALSELTRPAGRILITVPALPCLFGHHDVVLGHYRRYTRRSLLRLVRPHLVVEHIRYYGFSLIPVALVISRWLRRPYPTGSAASGSLVQFICSIEKRIRPPLGTSLLLFASLSDLNLAQRPQEAEGLDQPEDHNDHHGYIEDGLDLLIHRNIGVDQPQEKTNDHERND